MPVNFNQILTFAAQQKVSDLHFQPGSPPVLRRRGELIPVKHPPLTEEDTAYVAQHLVGMPDADQFRREVKDWDGTFALPNVGRFRVNVFRQRGRFSAVLRVIPLQPLSFDALGLPVPAMERIGRLQRGLVLVTGATGNGKSTTIASLIHNINTTRRAHVVTIEDPIEFLFENQSSLISQREVGSDTESFKTALRAALRQDPDVIMVGELRDHETVDICLKAAETGHLVLSTIHTQDAARTVGRLLGYFPPEEHASVRQRLAENLMAVISLRLLASKSGTAQVPACEIMMVTRSIEECIKNAERTDEIPGFIARSRDMGMQTINQSLVDLVRAERISMETAKMASSKPEELERDLMVE
ncbi:MAG: PilT/PilU family type 4a pilus ATPase [Vicinamibacteria bacterium]|jgi:twitching motility protein PilT|nr:PilT/PilU family type 4a pilus ATPase [Vicinamibacteria bacterium]